MTVILDGHRRVRTALIETLAAEHRPTPLAIADLFRDGLDDYAEIIVGPEEQPVGFMTRGEDRGFTARVQTTLEHLGMPDVALAHHRALAALFEHRRAFFKVEWRVGDTGDGGGARGVEPLAACYYRRRPRVETVLDHMVGWGVDAAARRRVCDLADALDKSTVHFVSAAFRPGRPVHHKLYFSQLVTPETRAQVTARITRVFGLFGVAGPALALWRDHHERSLPPGTTTLFVSMSFTRDELAPSFKIDYPEISWQRAAAWRPFVDEAQIMIDVERACELAGTAPLTFLGVRFHPDRDRPSLKYYCDIPAPVEPAGAPGSS